MNAFSTLIYEGKLSDDAESIASSGKSLVKNMLAAECITGYARLLENAFNFPSDVLLPVHISELKQASWEWNLFENEIEQKSSNSEYMYLKGSSGVISSIVDDLEEEMTNLVPLKNISGNDIEDLEEDIPTVLDWDTLRGIESSEEVERLETQEVWPYSDMYAIFWTPCFLLYTPILLSDSKSCIVSCRLRKEWRKTLVCGMRYIVLLVKLKSLNLKRMRGMKVS